MNRQSAARSGATLALLLVTSGCFGTRYIRSEMNPRASAARSEALTNHVVLISVDGLRPDAIGKFEAATLRRLMREGSFTLSATTIVPSKTLPSHTSMLTGQPPGVHGVLWNTKVGLSRKNVHAPTVFGVLRSEGLVTAAFFSKAKFSTLQRPGSLDYSEAPGGWWGQWGADRVVRDVGRYLAVERPNFLFVHFGDADKAGHASGWMSTKYGEAVRSVDASIADVLTAAEGAFGPNNYTVIVTADHGGHDRNHGTDDPRDVTIPWIAWGRAVRPGILRADLKTMDTASTILWLFRIPEPADWAGTPVTQAFGN